MSERLSVFKYLDDQAREDGYEAKDLIAEDEERYGNRFLEAHRLKSHAYWHDVTRVLLSLMHNGALHEHLNQYWSRSMQEKVSSHYPFNKPCLAHTDESNDFIMEFLYADWFECVEVRRLMLREDEFSYHIHIERNEQLLRQGIYVHAMRVPVKKGLKQSVIVDFETELFYDLGPIVVKG